MLRSFLKALIPDKLVSTVQGTEATSPASIELIKQPAERTKMYFNPKDFGVRMKEARKTKGLTQEKLSELLGVDRLHVNRMENGSKACSIDLLMDISSLLEVSTDYLLKGKPLDDSETKVRLLTAISELQSIANGMYY